MLVHEPDFSVSLAVSMSDEKRLIKHMLDNYNRIGKEGRPVLNVNSTLTIALGLSLIQLEVDETSQTLILNMWQRLASITLRLIRLNSMLQCHGNKL